MSVNHFCLTDFRCVECGNALALHLKTRCLEHQDHRFTPAKAGQQRLCSQAGKLFRLPTFELEEIPAPTAADFVPNPESWVGFKRTEDGPPIIAINVSAGPGEELTEDQLRQAVEAAQANEETPK
jgi:hypothetical protein